MAEPPELWTFVAANFVAVGFGCLLTALSYIALRTRSRSSTFSTATAGFGLITLGGAVEPVYQLGFNRGYNLGGRELLALQSTEGFLLALGLGLLFYSITNYDRPSARPFSTGVRDANDSR